MNVNIFSPGKAVDSAFEKPNLVLALILVLLSSLAFLGSRMALGIDVSSQAAYAIVFGFIEFFVFFLVALAIGLLLDFKKAKAKMLGLFSALSLVQVIWLIVMLLSIAFIPLSFSPKTVEFARNIGPATDEQRLWTQTEAFVNENPDAVNLPVFSAFLVIGLVLLAWGFYLNYLVLRRLTETKAVSSLFLTLIFWLVSGTLFLII